MGKESNDNKNTTPSRTSIGFFTTVGAGLGVYGTYLNPLSPLMHAFYPLHLHSAERLLWMIIDIFRTANVFPPIPFYLTMMPLFVFAGAGTGVIVDTMFFKKPFKQSNMLGAGIGAGLGFMCGVQFAWDMHNLSMFPRGTNLKWFDMFRLDGTILPTKLDDIILTAILSALIGTGISKACEVCYEGYLNLTKNKESSTLSPKS